MMARHILRIGLLTLCIGLLIGFGIRGARRGEPAATPQPVGIQESTAAWAERFQRLEAQVGRIERAVSSELSAPRPTPAAAAFPYEAGCRQELSRVLREELRALRVVEGLEEARRPADTVDTPEAGATPERQQAYDESYEVVLAAVAARRWTDDDAHTLRRTFGLLTDSQQDDILQLLIPAVNRGDIAVEALAGLF